MLSDAYCVRDTVDCMIVIEVGVVIQRGTCDETLRVGRRCAKLYAIQSGGVVNEPAE